MLTFLKRLFRREQLPAERDFESGGEVRTSPQTPLATGVNSAEYFSTMAKLQEAVSKRNYELAARLTRENIRQVSVFVRSTQLDYGSFDIRSIPGLEQGGTMLALVGDDQGLKEMQDLVRSLPELEPWHSTVRQHEEDRNLFAAILIAIEKNPGCLQTDVKELIGAEDGRRVANLISWLEKAEKISRTKKGRTYAVTLTDPRHVTEPAPKREISSHRLGKSTPRLREIDLERLPYVPLPRAPHRWEDLDERRTSKPDAGASDLFEIRDAEGWQLRSVEKIPVSERPNPAFRHIYPMNTGLIMVDDLGKSETSASAPAAVLRFGRAGDLVTASPLHHDIYRIGVNALGCGMIAMSKDCVVHAYDDALKLILETSLRETPEVRALQQRLGVGADELKNHLRCVALAYDNTRYLFTGVDEAWCATINGDGLWGLRLPLQEGWKRVAETSTTFGTHDEVMRALEVMNLSLPVTAEDVKRRYRELAKQWHPDLNPGNAGAEEQMKALTGAAEILTGIDPTALPRYAGATFGKEVSRQEFKVGDMSFTVSMGMQVSEVHAADWIYAAGFASRSHGTFVAGYSGRIIEVNGDGEPMRAYDIGVVPRRIIDTGDYLYLLTDTRLYVLRGNALHALVDTFDSENVVVAQTGFGLLEKKRFRWFGENGIHLGSIVTKDPIRRVYHRPDGMIVETRQHRSIIGGIETWWE
jgi:hypothetical protein